MVAKKARNTYIFEHKHPHPHARMQPTPSHSPSAKTTAPPPRGASASLVLGEKQHCPLGVFPPSGLLSVCRVLWPCYYGIRWHEFTHPASVENHATSQEETDSSVE